MAAVPSFFLILGSLLLVVWRPSGRRAAWAVEVSISSLALLAGLLLGRLVPSQNSFSLLPSELFPSASVLLALTPWTWALLICVLAFGLSRALASASSGAPPVATGRSAALAFTAAIALSTVAATMLSFLLTWTLAIGAQAWLVGTDSSDATGGPDRRLVQGKDFATLLLLMAAFALSRFSAGFSGQVALGLLGAAGLMRVLSAVGATPLRGGKVASLAFPTAASVLAAFAWGWGAEEAEAVASWLIAAGILLVLAGWISGWLAETPDHRARAWIAGIGGMALLAAAVSPAQAEAALALSGALLVLGGTMGTGLLQGRNGARVSSAVAGLMTVGIPGLVGAVLLGVLAPGGNASALGWIGVVGLGLLGSTFLMDARRPNSSSTTQATSPLSSVAAGLLVVLGAILYLSLRALVPPPEAAAAPVALVVAVGAALLWGRIPGGQRSRMARAFRWPVASPLARNAAAAVGAVVGLVRGARDVLEGDASLLWALVVVVVGLLLQGVM